MSSSSDGQKELVFAPTLDMPWWGYQQLDQGYGAYHNGDVNVYLRFENEKDSQLGIPMPAGRIRVNQLDPADGSLEFIGEDIIDHTPRNEKVTIELGNSFDVVGERKQSNIVMGKNEITETFEITLRNQKDTTGVSTSPGRSTNLRAINLSLPYETSPL